MLPAHSELLESAGFELDLLFTYEGEQRVTWANKNSPTRIVYPISELITLPRLIGDIEDAVADRYMEETEDN